MNDPNATLPPPLLLVPKDDAKAPVDPFKLPLIGEDPEIVQMANAIYDGTEIGTSSDGGYEIFVDVLFHGDSVGLEVGLFLIALAGRLFLKENGRADRGERGYVTSQSVTMPFPVSITYQSYGKNSTVHALTCLVYFFKRHLTSFEYSFIATYAAAQSSEFISDSVRVYKTITGEKKTELIWACPMPVSCLFKATSMRTNAKYNRYAAYLRAAAILERIDPRVRPLMERQPIVNTLRKFKVGFCTCIHFATSHFVILQNGDRFVYSAKSGLWDSDESELRNIVVGNMFFIEEYIHNAALPDFVKNKVMLNLQIFADSQAPKGIKQNEITSGLRISASTTLRRISENRVLAFPNGCMIVKDGELTIGIPGVSDFVFVDKRSTLPIPSSIISERDTLGVSTGYQVETDPRARPLFEEYRKSMFPKDLDWRQICFILTSLFARTCNAKKVPFFIGENGNEGKTLFFEIVRLAIGSLNAAELSQSLLMEVNERNEGGNSHTSHLKEIAELVPLGLISDALITGVLSMQRLKAISGRDPINYRAIRGDPTEIEPETLIIAAGNKVGKPPVEASAADLRRILPIDWLSRFSNTAHPDPEIQAATREYPLREYTDQEKMWLAGCLLEDIVAVWDDYQRGGRKFYVDSMVIPTLHPRPPAEFNAEMKEFEEKKLAGAFNGYQATPTKYTMQATQVIRAFSPGCRAAHRRYHQSSPWYSLLQAIIATRGAGEPMVFDQTSPPPEIPEDLGDFTLNVTASMLKRYAARLPLKDVRGQRSPFQVSEMFNILKFYCEITNVAYVNEIGGMYKGRVRKPVFTIGFKAGISTFSIYPQDFNAA